MRKAGYEGVNIQAATAYYPVQTQCALGLVKDLATEPSKWEAAMRKYVASHHFLHVMPLVNVLIKMYRNGRNSIYIRSQHASRENYAEIC